MNLNPTNFTEASLAEQIFANEDDAETKDPVERANLSIVLWRWHGGGFAVGLAGPEDGALKNGPRNELPISAI
jgi:hypothetical protein